MVMSEKELQEKLLEYLKLQYPLKSRIEVINFARITAGWETEIYSFTLKSSINNDLHLNDLILRVYPGDGAEEKSTKEFNVMAKLYGLRFPVPKVYYLETDQSVLSKPFVIMEKINGHTMGEILESSSEKTRKDMIFLFCKMFVDLHRLDIKPFLSDSSITPDPSVYDMENPYDYMTNLLEFFRRVLAPFQKSEFAPALFEIVDWLEMRKQSVPSKRLSLVHLDYHPYNILVRDDGRPFVIDWTNAYVTDYRVDLAWTLLLASTYGNPKMRNIILDTYEKIAEVEVENIEYFEVTAAARRLATVYISLSEGAEKLGMRPEAVESMKQQTEHIKAVIRVLSDRTGITIRKFEKPIDRDRC